MKPGDYTRRLQQPLLARRSSSFFGRKQSRSKQPSVIISGNFFCDEPSETPPTCPVVQEESTHRSSKIRLSPVGMYPLSAHTAESQGSALSMSSTSSDHLRDIESSQQQAHSLLEKSDFYKFKPDSIDPTLTKSTYDETKDVMSPVSLREENCNDIEHRTSFQDYRAKARQSMMSPTEINDSKETNDKEDQALNDETTQIRVIDRSDDCSTPSTESLEKKEIDTELPMMVEKEQTSDQDNHFPERKRTFRERLMNKVSPRRSQYRNIADMSDSVSLNTQKKFGERKSSLGRLWSVLSGGRQTEEEIEKQANEDIKKREEMNENKGPLSDDMDMSQPFHFLRSAESVDARYSKKSSPALASMSQPLRAKSHEHTVSKLLRPWNGSETDAHVEENGASRNHTGSHSSASSQGSLNEGKRTPNNGLLHRFSTRFTKGGDGDTERRSERPSRFQGALQNIMAGAGVSSRGMGSGVWKAGVYEFNCDAQTSFNEVRKLLEADYFGVVVSERFQELRMRVPLTVSSKLALINIVVTSETRQETSRVAIRRAFGDALCVRNDEFDWFCFDVYRRILKIRDVVRPYYS